ncbi:hypothetical protein JOD82_002294 [Paenibacillus sp. 1182]|uniref:hypothetical protein n=1 Tax=Paenibacillus sp. 1182 TaxID=2806565 RepID=UPI001AE8F0BB|nr:hypothetical protein [Paenibacillus sp. 1182]MBP1309274.1 hypothetical protein [Paenibacillus sp. 1182]
MKPITESTRLFLEQYYPQVKVNKHKVTIIEPYRMEIPSTLFPLRNKPTMSIYSYVNTQQINNDPIAEKAFNENTYKMGFCYTNTEKMLESFNRYELSEYESYVGWIIINGIPLHHAWLVYKNIHVLDPSITLVDEIIRERKYQSAQEMREQIVELERTFETKPNADYQTFGQAAPFVLYIGSVCSPDNGRQIFNEMIQQFPKHPSYQGQGMNPQGMSTVQQMYYSK